MTDASGAPPPQSALMTRPAHEPTRRPTREERALFEDLIALRQWYAGRGTEDGTAVATIHHVIGAANAEMRRFAATRRTTHFGLSAN